MNDLPDKIQWHPAFYAATGLELHENIEELTLLPEHSLSKEPIRIDLLIIKKGINANTIKNEIGHIMRRHNVLEYKSPEDSLTIDDFYKAVGYACLYKGYGESVNQIPTSELTVSLFREAYPRELFSSLKREGNKLEEKYPGIYYVTNNLPFPIQVVVTSQLRKETHSSLRILSHHADKDDIERFLEKAQAMVNAMPNSRMRSDIDSVLQVSVNANFKLYQEIRRNAGMCDALKELMKDDIEEQLNQARTSEKLEAIQNIMDSLQLSAEQAMDALKIAPEQRAIFMTKL